MINIEKRVKIFHLPSDLLFVTGGVGEVAPLRAPFFATAHKIFQEGREVVEGFEGLGRPVTMKVWEKWGPL
jgi:hypothetical protein